MKLTKATVAVIELPPGKTETIAFDESLPGFGLRIRAGGSKKWIIQFRVGQKQRRMTIGTVETLDPDQARRIAKIKLAQVHLGEDPQLRKSEARAEAAVTFGKVADDYLVRYASKRLKPKTLQEASRYLRNHWKPLSKTPIQKVTRADVAAGIARIAKDSGDVAANRARAALSGLYSWAIAEGLTESNPVVGTRKAIDEKTRERVLSDDELTFVWRHAGDGDFGDILQLLILTGQRREEVAAMTWDELDLEIGTWRISGERTKNHRPHDVPLSASAIGVLGARRRIDGRALVFGRSGPFSGWSKAKAALDRRIAVARSGQALDPWSIHDIRRTVATRMADLGVQPHIIEAVENRISGHKAGVAGVYNRSQYMTDKRAALELWARHVTTLVKGSS